ncbi:hypothetical protein FVE85_8182 [Porphyridium purpureum]|uniref:Fungal lipase-type domain-containing protein n=1 Tax=Porphyridium purpureum TaxID=35688 RepID=A0A5J4YNB2_PORPP|nr:hypothetical protein FVE85_8182 [Porphyridium purpureum]|eukprot:POR1825..scf295_9
MIRARSRSKHPSGVPRSKQSLDTQASTSETCRVPAMKGTNVPQPTLEHDEDRTQLEKDAASASKTPGGAVQPPARKKAGHAYRSSVVPDDDELASLLADDELLDVSTREQSPAHAAATAAHAQPDKPARATKQVSPGSSPLNQAEQETEQTSGMLSDLAKDLLEAKQPGATAEPSSDTRPVPSPSPLFAGKTLIDSFVPLANAVPISAVPNLQFAQSMGLQQPEEKEAASLRILYREIVDVHTRLRKDVASACKNMELLASLLDRAASGSSERISSQEWDNLAGYEELSTPRSVTTSPMSASPTSHMSPPSLASAGELSIMSRGLSELAKDLVMGAAVLEKHGSEVQRYVETQLLPDSSLLMVRASRTGLSATASRLHRTVGGESLHGSGSHNIARHAKRHLKHVFASKKGAQEQAQPEQQPAAFKQRSTSSGASAASPSGGLYATDKARILQKIRYDESRFLSESSESLLRGLLAHHDTLHGHLERLVAQLEDAKKSRGAPGQDANDEDADEENRQAEWEELNKKLLVESMIVNAGDSLDMCEPGIVRHVSKASGQSGSKAGVQVDFFELADASMLIADCRSGAKFVAEKYAALSVKPATLPQSTISYMTMVVPLDSNVEVSAVYVSAHSPAPTLSASEGREARSAFSMNPEHDASLPQCAFYIVIRGTDFTNLKHILIDMDSKLEADAMLGCEVHRGFRNSALELVAHVREDLNAHGRFMPIRIMGHSLGGSTAQLVGAFLLREGFNVERVLAFGSPKLTDEPGGRVLDALIGHVTLRISAYKDIVRTLPRKPRYKHFGKCVIFFDTGVVWEFAEALKVEPFEYINYSEALAHHRTHYYAAALAHVLEVKLDIQS